MENILEVRGLKKIFYKGKDLQTAVNGVSFNLGYGEFLGIAGESGCGKTTAVKMAIRLLDFEEGRVIFDGEDISRLRGGKLKAAYKKAQMIFQTPAEAFNPKATLGASVAEVMINRGTPKKIAMEKAVEFLEKSGLKGEIAKRFPSQVSGGQCQRAAIARAVAAEPKLLICDEITSALDATAQTQIMELIYSLSKENGMSVIFVSHDIAIMKKYCDRIIVMEKGRVAEEGAAEKIFNEPKSDCSKRLAAAAKSIYAV